MNALRLLGNDLRLLVRGRGVLAVLIVYPLIVAALVTLALQSAERRPVVAFVNNDTDSRTVRVGERRLGVREFEERLARQVEVVRMEESAASAALADGRISAVLTLPAGFIRDLQSSLRSPEISLRLSTRSPIEAQSITRRLEAAVFRLNQELADSYVRQTLDLVNIITDGGDIAALGRRGEVLGLTRSAELVREIQRQLAAQDDTAVARRLDPLLDFILAAGVNLDLANAAATAISRPITLTIPTPPTGREPLSGFGLAGALLVSLALIGVLLAAGAISSERQDHTLMRLRRGLVSDGALVAEKVTFAALVSVAIGAVVLVGVALSTSLAVGRWGLWLAVLPAAALAFASLGVAIGAAARETRGALLAALMIALPLVVMALFTQSGLARGLGQAAPFGPAFQAFQSILVDPSLDTARVWLRIAQLLGLTVVFGGAAAILLRRGSDT